MGSVRGVGHNQLSWSGSWIRLVIRREVQSHFTGRQIRRRDCPGRFFRLSLALLLLGPANPGATVLVMPIDVPKAMRLLNGIVPGPGTKCP